MSYQKQITYKGITLQIGDTFGVAFSWNNQELISAIANRDERIWEVLDWIVGGDAEKVNDAFLFSECELLVQSGETEQLLNILNYMGAKKIVALLDNPHLSEKSRVIVHDYLSGSIRTNKTPEIKVEAEGVVYLLQSGVYFKIGKTRHLPHRAKQLAIGVKVPFDIKLIHAFTSIDCQVAELKLHQLFHEKRVEGEWFTLLDEDVEYIKAIKDGGL